MILPSPSPSLLLPSSDMSDLVRAGSLGKGGLGGVGRQVGRAGIYVT